MLTKMLQQMLYQCAWSGTDILVIDTPPGTGDVHLTLCQGTPISGALIISTPSPLSIEDSKKGVEMFKRLNVPVLGLIQTMDPFICTNCQTEHHLFGGGTLEATASLLHHIPPLISIPFHSDHDHEMKIYDTLATRVIQSLAPLK